MAEVVQHAYQFKRGTAQRWLEVNPILRQGEPGFEYDTGKLKIGDGFTPWLSLPYINQSGGTVSTEDEIVIVNSFSDLPMVGNFAKVYRVIEDKLLYQWNSKTNEYEALGQQGGVEIDTNTNIFQIELLDETVDIDEAIAEAVKNAELNSGDILIAKIEIAEGKYSYTSYVYDGDKWIAMDGNYSADNVYIDSNITLAGNYSSIGNYSKGKQIAAGTSLQELLTNMLSQRIQPAITANPSISITLNQAGSYEVGTEISPTYSASGNDGAYTNEATTGVKFSEWNIKATSGETSTSTSGSFASFTVKEDTNYKLTATAKGSAGNIAKDNLGDPSAPAVQIAAKDNYSATSGAVSGYRAWFCGYKNGDNALAAPASITGEQVRALGNSANGSWLSQMSVNKMQQMYFAAPKGKGYKPAVKDHSTTAPQTVLGPIEVEVAGKNNFEPITYEVWYVANAAAASGSAVLDITKA